MVSHKNYNLSTNEGFEMFLTSKFIACFIDRLTLKMKSQSIACLLNGSEDIYWIWTLKVKCTLNMGFVNKWSSRMQGQWFFFRSRAGGQQFSVGSRKFGFSAPTAAPAQIYLPKKFVGGGGREFSIPRRFMRIDWMEMVEYAIFDF